MEWRKNVTVITMRKHVLNIFYCHLPFNRVIEKMIIFIQEYSIYSTILQYLKRVRASEFENIDFHKNEIQNVQYNVFILLPSKKKKKI